MVTALVLLEPLLLSRRTFAISDMHPHVLSLIPASLADFFQGCFWKNNLKKISSPMLSLQGSLLQGEEEELAFPGQLPRLLLNSPLLRDGERVVL